MTSRNACWLYRLLTLPMALAVLVLTAIAQARACDARAQTPLPGDIAASRYLRTPLTIGTDVEHVYSVLRVPVELAEPCFLISDDMTVLCTLGLSRIYHPGKRVLPANALPFPADSIQLKVLSAARLLIGYHAFYAAPPEARLDSVVSATREALVRLWGAPSASAGGCALWDNNHDTSTTWTATYCTLPERRSVEIIVAPRDAGSARAALVARGVTLPTPLASSQLTPTSNAWWMPVWRPLALGDLQPGLTLDKLASIVGTEETDVTCKRAKSQDSDDSLDLDCRLGAPRVEIAGLRPTALQVTTRRDTENNTTNAYSLSLTFGTFSRPQSAVSVDCRAVASVLVDAWGPPTEDRSDLHECAQRWERPPFRAWLATIVDDSLPGDDHWALLLILSVQPEALPPASWEQP